MSKPRTLYRCEECASTVPKWAGRCPSCGAWNALVEAVGDVGPGDSSADPPVPVAELDDAACAPVSTGLNELDRMLGGGLVPGSVTLLGGEPGIGKSTLALQLLAHLAERGARCLYVTAEESAQQVRLRARRVGALDTGLWVAAAAEITEVAAQVAAVRPTYLVVDSIQAVGDPDVASPPGSVAQVRACAHRLVQLAKTESLSTVLVGHVTKDGSLAGPRVLEHVVDTVLSFDGDRHQSFRVLRALKHRFGSTDEPAMFDMTSDGLNAVVDPAALFLGDRRPGITGSVVAAALDGRRPLAVEVQALVAPSPAAVPRRSAQGVDAGRLGIVLAVLERRGGLPLARSDVYVVTVGGAKVNEPGVDLAVALAVASSWSGMPVPVDLAVCGELGLGGEVRQASHLARRLAEVARLGFGHVMVPASSSATSHSPPGAGVTALSVDSLIQAMAAVGVDRRPRRYGREQGGAATRIRACPPGVTSG